MIEMSGYFSIILPLLSAAACFSLGLFTLLRNPRHPANLGFATGMATLVLIQAGSVMLMLSSSHDASLFSPGIKAYMAGNALLPAGWLLFTSAFARADRKQILSDRYPVLLIMAAISFVFALLILLDGYIPGFVFSAERWSVFSTENRIVFLGPAGFYMCIYILLGLILNLVHLENTLRNSSGTRRWQIKYVIFGVGAILGFFIYQTSQQLLFSSISIEIIPLGSAIILVSTMMVAVFIIRQRLLDVDIFISRYVVYHSFTVFAVGLYLLSVGIMYFKAPFDYFFNSLLVFLAILGLFILFFMQSLRRKVQLFINRHFYSHKYEFRDKWMETIEKMSSKRSIGVIMSTLAEMIRETTGSRGVSIWLSDPATGTYADTAPGKAVGPLGHDHPVPVRMKTCKDPFFLAEITGMSAELLPWTDAVLCVPLIAGEEPVGFAVLGSDISGEEYRQDDFDILKAMATQAAVQIKNIRLDQDIMSLKAMEGFSKASAFIMHDLKNLTNSLSLVSQNARHNMNNPSFQKDAIKTIDATVGRMKTVIDRLSASPKGQAIRPRDTDLRRVLNGALSKLAFSEKKEIRVTVSLERAPVANIDPDVMEMVFLNLLSNAYDSIDRSGEISVSSEQREGSVLVTVSDTGSGMGPEFVRDSLFRPFATTKKNGFGIGLYQCKSVIEAHGGTVDVESAIGAGTSFRILLPVETGPKR